MNPPMPPAAQDILDFWFGAGDRPRAEWFRKDPAFDAAVRERFGPLIEQALQRGIDDWAHSPQPALARIVVLDQFTRNVFRDTPAAFAGDALALAAAQELVAGGQDRRLTPLQRWFVYLPFEHAEDRAAQQESMRLFGLLAAEHPERADALEWARRHQVVIERFGRFPHRNAILGRASSAEEAAFLRQPGSSF
ncbi:MAG: DUF924 domain-containing protein [Rubrivivax sp.]|nr:DUF924 domain-containing protein [Rubrivivax sp.]